MNFLRFAGEFRLECREPNGEVCWSDVLHNDVTLEGLTEILNDFFNAGTQKTTWYIGLIDEANYSGISADDIMTSHAGWREAVNYTQSLRPQWTPLVVSSGVAGNASPAQFTMNTLSNIKGIFLTSSNVKNGTAGKLWNRGILPITRTVAVNQTLTVSYTVRAVGGA